MWSVGAMDAGFSWLGAMIAGAFFGGAAGVAIALAAWRVAKQTDALPETSNVDVGRYEVVVERRDAPKARELLDR
jgi:hypothetical protein